MPSMYQVHLRKRLQPDPATLMRVFGLTYCEARLACAIANGIAPEQIAQELGRSSETVRNQLKGVFGKTDTHRQSELAALVLQFAYQEVA